MTGAVSYRVARWGSAWSPVASGTTTQATIPWRLGIAEYGVFAIMPGGDARLIGRGWTSQ